MSTVILEGLMCFLISFACIGTCCRVTKGCSCRGDYKYDGDIRDEPTNNHYNSTLEGNIPSQNLKETKNSTISLVGKDIVKENIECCICLENYLLKEELHLLICGHYFHKKCYKKWYAQSRKIKEERCPTCQEIVSSRKSD